MNCSEFIAHFSEYYDGGDDGQRNASMEAHLEACASCRRYHRVVSRGGQMLRALPKPPVPTDFRGRLQHRIYHIEDGVVLARPVSSGTTGVTTLAMAVLVSLAAWTPTVTDSAPMVEVAPIVVQTPFAPVPAFAFPGSSPLLRPSTLLNAGSPPSGHRLWANTHSLMYEYSPLSEKYRRAAEVRRSEL
jgi:hypothetical protein